MKFSKNYRKKILSIKLEEKELEEKINSLDNYRGKKISNFIEEIDPNFLQILYLFKTPEIVLKSERKRGIINNDPYIYLSSRIFSIRKFKNSSITKFIARELELWLDQYEQDKGYEFIYSLEKIKIRFLMKPKSKIL